jgi:hypothetical protein
VMTNYTTLHVKRNLDMLSISGVTLVR